MLISWIYSWSVSLILMAIVVTIHELELQETLKFTHQLFIDRLLPYNDKSNDT
jgi:hypothetical protein